MRRGVVVVGGRGRKVEVRAEERRVAFFLFFFSNSASSEIAPLFSLPLSLFLFLSLTCVVFCTSPRLWMFPKNFSDLAFWMRLEMTACGEEGEKRRERKMRNRWKLSLSL